MINYKAQPDDHKEDMERAKVMKELMLHLVSLDNNT